MNISVKKIVSLGLVLSVVSSELAVAAEAPSGSTWKKYLAAAAAMGAASKKEEVYEFDRGIRKMLKMTVDHGAISVVGARVPSISIKIDKADQERILSIKDDGEIIEIKTAPVQDDAVVRFGVVVPDDMSVNIHSDNGYLHAEGVKGKLKQFTKKGSVTALGVINGVNACSECGDVHVQCGKLSREEFSIRLWSGAGHNKLGLPKGTAVNAEIEVKTNETRRFWSTIALGCMTLECFDRVMELRASMGLGGEGGNPVRDVRKISMKAVTGDNTIYEFEVPQPVKEDEEKLEIWC